MALKGECLRGRPSALLPPELAGGSRRGGSSQPSAIRGVSPGEPETLGSAESARLLSVKALRCETSVSVLLLLRSGLHCAPGMPGAMAVHLLASPAIRRSAEQKRMEGRKFAAGKMTRSVADLVVQNPDIQPEASRGHSNKFLSRKISISHFKESRKWIINPEESIWLRRWDCMMMVALVFVCMVTPYEVAFLNDGKDLEWLSNGADPLFWINRIMDLVFVMDMLMQFFIMYPIMKRYGSVYVSDRCAIVKHYCGTWFGVDLISVVPYEIIGIVVSSGDVVKLKALRAVRLLRLLKLIRIVRGFRILHRWEVEMSFSYRRLTLWGLLVTVCLSAHWMSCALGMVSSMQGDYCVEAGDPPDCVETWFSSVAGSIVREGLEVTSFRFYLSALHVTATILVHPYQASATSVAEQVCFTILVFAGGFIWTKVISRTTAVQTSLDRHGIFYRQTMDDLNMNIKDLMLSAPLQRRLRGFFTNMRDTSQRSTWQDLTKRMSPALQTEVAVELHKVWLRRVPFLAGSSRFLVAELAQRIFTEHYAQQETFGSNFRLYVANRGLCSRTSGMKSRIKLLLPGSVWGLEHLVFNTAELLEPNTATGITFCEVLVLSRDHFEQVKADFPENLQRIRKYYVKMVVIRGVIRYAQDIIRAEQEEKAMIRESLKVRRLSITAMSDRAGSGEEENEEEGPLGGVDQHRTHAARMQRDMTRRIHEFTKRKSGMSGIPSRRSSLSTEPDSLKQLEERLVQRIDHCFGMLAASLDEFKQELREDLEANGIRRAFAI